MDFARQGLYLHFQCNSLCFSDSFFFFQVRQIFFPPWGPKDWTAFLQTSFSFGLRSTNHEEALAGWWPRKWWMSMELYPLSVSSPLLLCKFLLRSQKQPTKFHNKQTKRENFLKYPALLHSNYFFSPDIFCRISAVLIEIFLFNILMICLLLPWPKMCVSRKMTFFLNRRKKGRKWWFLRHFNAFFFFWAMFRIWFGHKINQNLLPSWFWRGIFVSSPSLVLLKFSHYLKKHPSTFLHIPSHEIFCYMHISLAVDTKICPASVSSDKGYDLVLHMASRASAELQATPHALCADFRAQLCDWGIYGLVRK